MKSNLFVKLSFIIILININIFVSAELCKDDFQNDGSKTRAFNQNIEMDKPNIVIILVDDMGFNDVSIHGSNQIPTPNIDALGIMGIQLNQMYVAPMCTPSRSSLLTGKYASNLGMQHYVISSDEPYGLDPHVKTMAEYLKQGGYRTNLVGKWHLGFFDKKYTPLYRGFDSHFGYYGGYLDYFNHSLTMADKNYSNGLDMRNNLSVNWNTIGQYATDLFTDKSIEMINNHDKRKPMFLLLSHLAVHAGNVYDPLQAPKSEINKFTYIQNKDRQVYAAMVSKLDESVGKVVKALDQNAMLNNTIILFMSDNGAPTEGLHSNSGSNFPFKGQKDSPWQGAIRSVASIWSTRLKQRQRVSNQMIHITDWLPTFANIAGIKLDEHIDGINVWDALSYNKPSPRKEILAHHDYATPYMAYISDNFKLVSGTTNNGTYDGWLSKPIKPSEQNVTFGERYSDEILQSNVGQALLKFSNIRKPFINDIRSNAQVTCNGHQPPSDSNRTYACNPLESPCLFDIVNDPCETTNLASKYLDIVNDLQTKINYYGRIAKPIRNQPSDPRCNPANFGGIWTWWFDEKTTWDSTK